MRLKPTSQLLPMLALVAAGAWGCHLPEVSHGVNVQPEAPRNYLPTVGEQPEAPQANAREDRSAPQEGNNTSAPVLPRESIVVVPTTVHNAAAPAHTPAPEGRKRVAVAYPTGKASTSVVLLEKLVPNHIVVGEPFDFVIRVTNLTDLALANVVVKDHVSPNLRIDHSEPAPHATIDGVASWLFEELAASQTKEITIKAAATGRGELAGGTHVTYDAFVFASLVALEPELTIELIAPPEAILCDSIPVEYKVKNVGTGTAKGVEIKTLLPENLRREGGASDAAISVGDLAAGAERTVHMNLKALLGGTHEYLATVASAGAARAETPRFSTVVRQPVLELTCTGADEQYLGRDVVFEIVIRNTGDAIAHDTVINNPMPDNVDLVRASDNGYLKDSAVRWDIGDLLPGDFRTVSLSLNALATGDVTNSASAAAKCGWSRTAAASTTVKGITAIRLEVVDVADPIEVGQDVTYRVVVSNQGTAVGTGIRLTCLFEESMAFLASSGPTSSTTLGQAVTFDALDKLGPQEEATWEVSAKVLSQGDARFTVKMQTDQQQRPVQEMEATTLYE